MSVSANENLIVSPAVVTSRNKISVRRATFFLRGKSLPRCGFVLLKRQLWQRRPYGLLLSCVRIWLKNLLNGKDKSCHPPVH